MKKLLFILTALLLLSNQAHARYCTTKNWNTAKNLYKKYEGRYNKQVDEFNKVIETYNTFEFFSKTYNIKEFSKVWGLKQEALTQAVNMQKELSFAEVKKFDNIKRKINAIIKGLDKSKKLWSKLAEYCYDEDNYKSYKAGRNNMRDAIRTKKKALELIDRINGLRLKYLEEVGFINQSKDIYEASCKD